MLTQLLELALTRDLAHRQKDKPVDQAGQSH